MDSKPPNQPEDLSVLFEDNHCLAVFKSAGILTAGDKTGDQSLLDAARQYIKRKYDKPGKVYLGVVHRLDRPVSGIVLFARTSKAAARLSEQFRTARVHKVYCAYVEGTPERRSGELVDYLVKDPERNIVSRADPTQQGARRAQLEYRVLRRSGAYTLLEVTPETGRPHQIRVQLAGHGTPVAGDVKYGAKRLWARRIALHATVLEFDHPVLRNRVRLTAAPPTDWDQFNR